VYSNIFLNDKNVNQIFTQKTQPSISIPGIDTQKKERRKPSTAPTFQESIGSSLKKDANKPHST
jgi:hypothetical protein